MKRVRNNIYNFSQLCKVEFRFLFSCCLRLVTLPQANYVRSFVYQFAPSFTMCNGFDAEFFCLTMFIRPISGCIRTRSQLIAFLADWNHNFHFFAFKKKTRISFNDFFYIFSFWTNSKYFLHSFSSKQFAFFHSNVMVNDVADKHIDCDIKDSLVCAFGRSFIAFDNFHCQQMENCRRCYWRRLLSSELIRFCSLGCLCVKER